MTNPILKWAMFVWPSDEVWMPVVGFVGYEVSDHGRIRSLRRRNARLLTPQVDDDGYLYVRLYDGKRYTKLLLARGICHAFNGPPPVDKPICCHRDNDPRNNRPANLRWDTQAGNMADKLIHGTHQIGSKHPRARIDEAAARRVKDLLAAGATPTRAAQEVGISRHIANDISRGRTWGHA